MELDELKIGTRIYYGGDMANQPDFGIISKQTSDKWGQFVCIVLDDGRKINHLPIVMFSQEYKGHGGTRFVTLDAYNTFRRRQIEAMNLKYKPAI